MSDSITQTRLAMRLDNYQREYTGMGIRGDAHSQTEWKTRWRTADAARAQNTLTPEIVDDVRKALKNMETA